MPFRIMRRKKAWALFPIVAIASLGLALASKPASAAGETLSLSAPAPIVEGNSGVKTLTFPISSPAAPSEPCTVLVGVYNGGFLPAFPEPNPALWGFDWRLPAPNTLVFSYFKTISTASDSIAVEIIGDTIVEADEGFTASISGAGLNPCNVAGTTSTVRGVITNDDYLGSYSVTAAAPVVEGNSGVTNMTFPISSPTTPSTPCELLVTVENGGFRVPEPNPAIWLFDWRNPAPNSAVYFYNKTVTAATDSIVVEIIGDLLTEADEKFTVTISPGVSLNPCGVAGGIQTVKGTILDDDGGLYSIAAAPPVIEGNSGVTTMTFPVTSTRAPSAPCQVLVTALNATAIWPFDWKLPAPNTAVFSYLKTLSGTSETVTVEIVGDIINELDETFTVNIVPAGATPCGVDLTKNIVTATITNDDAPPVYSIASPAPVFELDSGTNDMVFTISSATQPSTPCTVLVTALNATAIWPFDWRLPAPNAGVFSYLKTLTSATETVTVEIVGETIDELDETFTVNIVPAGATPCGVDLTKNIATGTIMDNESVVKLPGAPPTTAPATTTPTTAPATTAPATTAPATTAPATTAPTTASTTAPPPTTGGSSTNGGTATTQATTPTTAAPTSPGSGAGANLPPAVAPIVVAPATASATPPTPAPAATPAPATPSAPATTAAPVSAPPTTAEQKASVPPPVVLAEQITAPAAAPAASPEGQIPEVEALAFTGASNSVVAGFALLLILTGATLLVATSKRRFRGV